MGLSQWIINNTKEISDFILTCYMDDGYPEKVLLKIRQDTEHNLRFLAYAIALDSQEAFVNYSKWLREVLHHLNFTDDTIRDNYHYIKDALSSFFRDEKLQTAHDFIDAGLGQLKDPLIFTPHYITECNPFKDVATQYMSLVLKRNQKDAYSLLKNIKDHHSINHVYRHILQPSLYEVGRQWQLRKLSVAEEHYFSNTTDRFISQLSPFSLDSSKEEKSIITCCVGKETHELGIKMIANALDNKGYNNIHLGAFTPVEAVLDVLKSQEIHAIVASTTMLENVTYLSQLIKDIKKDQLNVKVLVGGHAFNADQNLWKKIQADGYSKDVDSALDLLRDLMAS